MNQSFFYRALLFEFGLGVIALLVAACFGVFLWNDIDLSIFSWGVAVIVTLPLLLAYFIVSAIPLRGLRQVQEIVEKLYREYLSHLSVFQLALLSLAAGFGEELLFRGLFQRGMTVLVGYCSTVPVPESGFADGRIWFIILIVSLLFGIGHAITKTYFVLSFLVSVYFGILFQATNNLLLPVLVHAFYDFFVFMVLYRTHHREKRVEKSTETPPLPH